MDMLVRRTEWDVRLGGLDLVLELLHCADDLCGGLVVVKLFGVRRKESLSVNRSC
jgi:hypothetical protein